MALSIFFHVGREDGNMVSTEKSYEKVIEYVRNHILKKEFKIGDKLLSERELAVQLGISRNSVREGLRILERMGVLCSQQGAGNYIVGKFESTLTEVLSMMYTLRDMEMEQVTQFRHGLEYGAMNLAVFHATEEEKERMKYHLQALEEAESEEVRIRHDKAIHYLLIEASRNKYMLVNFIALTQIMDFYIPTMRGKILNSMKTEDFLYEAHELIVKGVVEGNLEKGMRGLALHFKYINDYRNS